MAPKTKKESKCGGSLASEAVNGFLDVGAFERIEFLMKGGSALPLQVPNMTTPSFDQGNYAGPLNSSMVDHMNQPGSTIAAMNTGMTWPSSEYNRFIPSLSSSTAQVGGKKRSKK
jgi:hypothetical protein